MIDEKGKVDKSRGTRSGVYREWRRGRGSVSVVRVVRVVRVVVVVARSVQFVLAALVLLGALRLLLLLFGDALLAGPQAGAPRTGPHRRRHRLLHHPPRTHALMLVKRLIDY